MKVVIIVVAGLVSVSCASTSHHASDESGPVTVAIGRAMVTDVASSFEAGGIVRAGATALIASRVMAPITAIPVRAGDRVRRGATLVTLDARDIRANSSHAEAASLSAAEHARAAESDLRSAESAVVLARATHDRMATLHAKRSATAQEFDEAIAALAGAEARRASGQARLAAAVAARDAAIASAEGAAVTAAYARLSAPFDGVITERRADPGSTAMPGMPLLALEDPASYRLEVQLDEARATLVDRGHTVAARTDDALDGDGRWVNGRVVEIGRVDPASHAFLVKIDLPHAASLRSGLFGRARFPTSARRTLTVPSSAVVARGQLRFVFLVDADSRARLRPISPGSSDHDRIEVLAGLRDQDAIVMSPPAALTDGVRVVGGRP